MGLPECPCCASCRGRASGAAPARDSQAAPRRVARRRGSGIFARPEQPQHGLRAFACTNGDGRRWTGFRDRRNPRARRRPPRSRARSGDALGVRRQPASCRLCAPRARPGRGRRRASASACARPGRRGARRRGLSASPRTPGAPPPGARRGNAAGSHARRLPLCAVARPRAGIPQRPAVPPVHIAPRAGRNGGLGAAFLRNVAERAATRPVSIGPLGVAGVAALPRIRPGRERQRALPRLIYPALPAIWDADGLAAVPHLGYRRSTAKMRGFACFFGQRFRYSAQASTVV